MSTEATLVAHVILDSPLPQLDHAFDYKVPERLLESIAVGQKVVVPLRSGRRMCDAWVIGLSKTSSFSGNLVDVESIVSEVALLPPDLYALARTVADRQAGSAVDVLRLAIPPRYVRAEKAYLTHRNSDELSESSVSTSASRVSTADQKLESPEFSRGDKVSWIFDGGVACLGENAWVPSWCHAYAQLAAQALSRGESIILCVPDFRDIALMQFALTFFVDEERVCRVDAGLAGAQRYTNYLRILEDSPVVVLGNRSSIYAPVFNLGVIALWDAADESFAEPLAPYAHSRDIALIRQASAECTLVFGAHVLSPEVARLLTLGYVTDISSPVDEKISGRPIIVTDDLAPEISDDAEHNRSSSRIPASVVIAARKAITQGPVLIQVARPGYSGALRCKSCKYKACCENCSGPLRLESKNATPACKWCARLAPRWQCSQCHSTAFSYGAPGNEKTAEDLGRAFPGVPVILVDASRPVETLEHVPSLVIATPGTEPLARGGYESIIILDGETTLSREGLDTDADALRVWLNAASLAAKNAPVFIAGTGVTLGHVMRDRQENCYVLSLLTERETLSLPPATRVALISGSRESVASVESALTGIPRRSVMGPVPGADGSSRLILTFDYKDGAAVAKALRALVIKTATTSKKPAGSDGPQPRILRLNVRMDDTALRGVN